MSKGGWADTQGAGHGELLGEITRRLEARPRQIAVMESCSGGGFADALTDVPEISACFRGGIVAYATDLKANFGVSPDVIVRFGVVSRETALAMAEAVRDLLEADVGVSITGVAGPDPQDEKPLGEVHIAACTADGLRVARAMLYPSTRKEVKRRAITEALELLRDVLEARSDEV